jgi:hypothetical protein
VRALPILAVAVLAIAGCGGGTDDDPTIGGGTDTVATDTATATAPASPPEEIATVPEREPPATVTAPAPAPTSPEDAPGGAGDEEGIHVPARFTLQGGRLQPASVEVPAFLGVAVTVDNTDATSHRLEVGDRGAQLPAGRTTTLSLPGRPAADLPVLIDGNEAGTLRITAEKTP